MNMNKKIILFCAVSLIAICVLLTDRGTTSKEHEKPAQIAEETSQQVVSTGAAVISSVSKPAVQDMPCSQGTPDSQSTADSQSTPDAPAGEEQSAGQGHGDPDQIRESGEDEGQGNAGGIRQKKDSSGQSNRPAAPKKNKTHSSEDRGGRSDAGKTTAKPSKSSKPSTPAKQTAPAAASSKAPQRPADTAETKNQCTLQITCSSVLAHMDQLKENLKKIIPPDGVILEGTYEFTEGDTVFDLLKKVCSEHDILIDYVFTPGFSTYYIKGINQLYEFDCGDESGWMYSVNGKNPDMGCSQYKVKKLDNIVFYYTCER